MPKEAIIQSNHNTPATISPWYQIIFILISIAIISKALYDNMQSNFIYDEAPHIIKITPKEFKELNGFPSFISTGIHINKFEKFDTIKNEFLIDGILWFKLVPGTISLQTLELFSFDRGEIIKKSPPDIHLENDQIVIRYGIKIKFSTNLNYINFPIDNHRIYLTLSHEFVSPREIQFVTSEHFISLDTKALPTGWSLLDQNATSGYEEALFEETTSNNKKKYPAVLFSFDFERYGFRHLLTILLPLLLSFYIGLFSLSSSRGGIRIGIVSITAIVSYRFVIDRFSPNVGYFMISDYLFFLFLFAALIPFIGSIAANYNRHITPLLLKLMVCLLHIIVIVTSWIILH